MRLLPLWILLHRVDFWLELKGIFVLVFHQTNIFSGKIIELVDEGDLKQVQELASFAHSATVNQVAFCPVLDDNSRQLAASCGDDNQVKVFVV